MPDTRRNALGPAAVVLVTALVMLAFAGNGLLCRVALQRTTIDPATFTAVRLASGALMLALLVWFRRDGGGRGSWASAASLFAYAATFSFAYLGLTAATGALLLFGAVQATMVGHGLHRGERLSAMQSGGLLVALAGLVALLLPGLSAPPLMHALLMIAAGVAWGMYSLQGRRASGDPTRVTAGNFLRAVPMAVVLGLFMTLRGQAIPDPSGIGYAIVSGAVTSGIGYALWYAVLPSLKATHAATLQLSVPVLTAIGGVLWLGEAMTPRLWLASITILGGIALVILCRPAGAQATAGRQ